MKNQDVIQGLTYKVDYLINRFDEYVLRDAAKTNKSEIDNLLDDKVDATQAAAILKRSLSSIYSKCSSGELKHTKDVGGRLVFSKKYLLTYLENKRNNNSVHVEELTPQPSFKMRSNRKRFSQKK